MQCQRVVAAVGALLVVGALPGAIAPAKAATMPHTGAPQRPASLWRTAEDARAVLHRQLAAGARLLVVSAHPDDETLFGPLLAEFCGRGTDCRFAVLTHGEGGNCSRDDDCLPDLVTVRSGEMAAVATAYGASLTWGAFPNFPLTTGDEATRRAILAAWRRVADPVAWIRAQIRAYDPNIVMTVDGTHGFYGHPEHILVGALTVAALTPDVDPTSPLPASDRLLVQVLNRYWAFAPAVGRDPGPVDTTWPTRRNCDGRPCMDVAIDRALLHASQMGSGIRFFRWVGPLIGRLYLRITPVPAP